MLSFTYLFVLIATISVPLLVSRTKAFYFLPHWPKVFKHALWVSIPFLVWDVYFTHQGHWGFSDTFHLPIKIVNLPVEEVLFFLIIPAASVFLFYCVDKYYGGLEIPSLMVAAYKVGILLIALFLIVHFSDRIYSLWVSVTTLATLALIWQKSWWKQLVIFTPFILMGFIFVNGILTGFATQINLSPPVWYNSESFSGIRLGSIPLEDFLYAFSLLSLNIFLFQKHRKDL